MGGVGLVVREEAVLQQGVFTPRDATFLPNRRFFLISAIIFFPKSTILIAYHLADVIFR
jgi:hypothetical protein